MNKSTLEKHKILLVEDEENLAIGLQYNLTEEGYIVELAKDGREALKLFETKKVDLIVLDIMIPYIDGFEIARRVRKKDPQMPILMLTARTTREDKVKGLELGADDYITKPFHLAELNSRVNSLIRRRKFAGSKNIVFQEIEIDPDAKSVIANKIPGCGLKVISGAGHMSPLTHPEDVAKELEGHFRAVEAEI